MLFFLTNHVFVLFYVYVLEHYDFVNNADISTLQDIMWMRCSSIASIYYFRNKFTEILLDDTVTQVGLEHKTRFWNYRLLG